MIHNVGVGIARIKIQKPGLRNYLVPIRHLQWSMEHLMHDICHPTILVSYAKPLARNDVDIPPLALSHGGRITGLLNLVKLDPSKGETPDSVAQPTFLTIFKRGAFNLLLHGEAPEFP